MLEAIEPIITIDIDHIITEDDEPVENFYSAKQQRLMVRSLYSDWQLGRPFLADANVGLFPNPHETPIVPDMFLSVNVTPAEDWYAKRHRTYFMWEFGKSPEFVLEVVSDKKGRELEKREKYARMGIWYYAIYDPRLLIQSEKVQLYDLWGTGYRLKDNLFLDRLDLGLVLWEGEFEQRYGEWLRWVDIDGHFLLTGNELSVLADERADLAEERAESAEVRADIAEERAESAENLADKLAAKLRELGIDPDTL